MRSLPDRYRVADAAADLKQVTVTSVTCGAVRLFAHLGGYAGGQAEYLRAPYADVGPIKVPDHLTGEQVLFLSDIFPIRLRGTIATSSPARRSRFGAAARSDFLPSGAPLLLGADVLRQAIHLLAELRHSFDRRSLRRATRQPPRGIGDHPQLTSLRKVRGRLRGRPRFASPIMHAREHAGDERDAWHRSVRWPPRLGARCRAPSRRAGCAPCVRRSPPSGARPCL